MEVTLAEITSELNDKGARLVAVSKTKPAEAIRKLYDCGQRIFGENRVEEMAAKRPHLPDDIEWHMIGHLQSKKVKLIAPFVQMIHSVDTVKLLREIDKQAARNDRKIQVLIQCKIAAEESKYGLRGEEGIRSFCEEVLQDLPGHVRICGVMGMASFVSNDEQIRSEFRKLKQYFDLIKAEYFTEDNFSEISMGMSGDYQLALEEGSTMVRIGSLLFGPRS